jgi:predicted O-linked N-acetylglucosamine transferase (SPINDLY family)
MASLDEAWKWMHAKKYDRAEREFRLLEALRRDDPDVLRLGMGLRMAQDRSEEAGAYAKRIYEREPTNVTAASDYALFLNRMKRRDEAFEVIRPFLTQPIDDVHVLNNLSAVLYFCAKFTEAEAMCRRALAIAPDHANVLGNLALILHETGRTEEALPVAKRCVALDPAGKTGRLESATFTTYTSTSPQAVLRAHAEFGAWMDDQVPPVERPAMPPREGRLRIGLISPDFRRHSVAFFAEAIFRSLDPARFELFAYSTSPLADEVTARLKSYRSTWRDVARAGREEQRRVILKDRLHALVELTGLTNGHSLKLLASRPAPLQFSYCGYPATTGCSFMSARIVDELTDPPGAEKWHMERVVRMPAPFLCYAPPPAAEVRPLDTSGPPTLACYGFIGKYTAGMLRLWGRLLARVPEARLAIKSAAFLDPGVAAATVPRLAAAGIDPARLHILPYTPTHAEHLASYDRAWVALDTFPYHGTTTTCEAMLMGVPTLSLIGELHASRVGLTLLAAVGLADLAAPSEDEFVERGAALLRDTARLRRLRETLRPTLLASPLCDHAGFGRRFGAVLESEIMAYRG